MRGFLPNGVRALFLRILIAIADDGNRCQRHNSSMPRMARLALPGVPLHVVQRGNNRQPCFYHASDYQFYLETAFACAKRYQVAVHAYVLMTNHVHLPLTPEKSGVSRE